MSFKKNANQTVISEETYACQGNAGDAGKVGADLVSVKLRRVNDHRPVLTLNFHVPGRKRVVETGVTRQTLTDLRDMFAALVEDLS